MLNFKFNKIENFYRYSFSIYLIIGFAFTTALSQVNESQNTNLAASSSSQTVSQRANQYFQSQDWKNAIEAYSDIVKLEPKDGRAWYRLGFSYYSIKEYQKAVEAFTKAVEIGANPVAMYKLACTHAQAGNKEKAFEWLNESVNKGFNQLVQVKNDKDLTSLRSDARFEELLKKVEKAAFPCAFSPESRQFDFWVGQWDVKNPQGFLAGTNIIERVVGDCALIENWTSSQGNTGKSFNFYNGQTKKWHQTWIDDKGEVINFVGEFKDNKMAFQAENLRPDGQKVLRRLAFYFLSPDLVRQHGEISTDNGSSWNTEYDFSYHRRK